MAPKIVVRDVKKTGAVPMEAAGFLKRDSGTEGCGRKNCWQPFLGKVLYKAGPAATLQEGWLLSAANGKANMEEQQQQPGAQTRTGKIKEQLHHLEERAQQFGGKAAETVGQLRDRAGVYREGASEFIDSMAVYIKENPQRSAMIAAGVGVGFGIILGMMMRGNRR